MEIEWVVAAGFVTWLMTTLGWLVVNRHANAREARKEYRSAVDSLEADVDQLLEAYREYLTETKATENEQARLRVHSAINRLRRHVASLADEVGPPFQDGFTNLYEVVTGGSFESRKREPSRTAEDYARSVAAAEEMIDSAERWFRERYIETGALERTKRFVRRRLLRETT